MINIEDFRDSITGKYDLQGAIDLAIATTKYLRMPAGIYEPEEPVKIEAPIYGTLRLEGDHQGYHWGTPGTIIDARGLPDASTISINGGRAVHISGIQLSGANDRQPNQPKPDQSEYVKEGLSTGRYDPYAGITIDSIPGKHSAQVEIRDVFIRDYVVGLMISPENTVNADRIDLVNSSIGNCDIGWSSGQAQTRACNIVRTNIGGCRICVDGNTYGKRQGSPPKVWGGQMGTSYQMFNVHKSFGSGLSVYGLYAEAVRCIGRYGFGPTRSQNPAVFSGCDFNLSAEIYSDPPPPDVLGSWAPLMFQGCTLGFHPDNALFTGDGYYIFDCVSFSRIPDFTWSPHELRRGCYSFS